MTEYAILPATVDHALALAENMRQADVDEVYATGGYTPLKALEVSMRATRTPLTGLADGEVAVMFGVAAESLISPVGVPWLLTSYVLEDHKKQFMRQSRLWVKKWKSEYSLLANFVDARHKSSILWLSWLGFIIYPAQPAGYEGRPLHLFEMRS